LKEGTSSGHQVKLTVVSGPDLGKVLSFDKEHITLGRDVHNDFVLTDGFVSNWHSELLREQNSYVYYDLRSRHGSLVLIDDVSINLHDSNHVRHVRVVDGSEIQCGSTLMRLEIIQSKEEQDDAPTFRPRGSSEEKYITAAHRPIEDWTRNLGSKDTRLEILLRLANQLNSLNRIEEILDLIVGATFEAFPAANFFAISLIDEAQELTPFVTRNRHGSPDDTQSGVILSQSILQRVVETRESVLFVRDHLGAEISQSILEAQITACLCAPLVGQRSLIGVMQVDTRGQGSLFSRQDLDLFSVLASSTAFAIERARLSEDIYNMFEGFVQASVTAIEARDPTTAGHSERVAQYTLALAESASRVTIGPLLDVHFTPPELTELRYAALLHDFGKVGVRESVLTKHARVDDTEMALIAQRFANFKHILEIGAYSRLMETLAKESRCPCDADLHQMRTEHAEAAEELEDYLRFVAKARSANWLDDEQVARIQAIGLRTVTTPDGRSLPLLTQDELTNLTIQKGNLNEEEWQNMRAHAAKSQDYLDQIPWSAELKRIPCFAGMHHEKLNGTGYPRGLDAVDIPPQVRILTIADIYDAITASDRPYKKSSSPAFAAKVLREEAAGGQLDQPLVELFIDQIVPTIRGAG
jgi:HD-GYP domain-containing protein (c-di-GMP phosphodiesterase class II)